MTRQCGRFWFALTMLLACLAGSSPGQVLATALVHVTCTDTANRPLRGVRVSLESGGAAVAAGTSNARGVVSFSVQSGSYLLTAAKKGYFPVVQPVRVLAPRALEVALQFAKRSAVSKTVTVTASPEAAQGASSPAQLLEAATVRRLPVPGQQLQQALPLVPGVVRTPDGRININGARENENAMQINGADASDPATGNFSVNLPLDVVRQVQVFQAPYLAEYGQFTGGVTKVLTRGGGDEWRFEVNDFFPEPRFRSGTLFGFRGITPRLLASGPLLPRRLYLSQGVNYDLDKTPIRGLPFPFNISKTEGGDAFTQLDWVISPRDLVTLTANYAPRHIEHAHLDVFLPQPAAPDLRRRNLSLNLIERHGSATGAVWQNTFNWEHFVDDVWGEGNGPMILRSSGAQGSFFNTQRRDAWRVAWESAYLPAQTHWHGSHQWKIGGGAAASAIRGSFLGRPVQVFRPDGTLSQTVQFTGGSLLAITNTTWNAYAEDQWAPDARLALDLGLRYESETISDAVHLAPRAGFSWQAPAGFVLRGGAGIFYDRLPLDVGVFRQYPRQTVTYFNPAGTGIVAVEPFTNILTDFTAEPSPNQFLPGGDFNFLPFNLTWNVEAERRLGSHLLLDAGFLQSHTRRQFIVDPLAGAPGQYFLTLSNSGQMRYSKEVITAKINLAGQAINSSFVHSRTHGDLNNYDYFFGDFPHPIIRPNEYGPLPSDVPNRWITWGVLRLPQATTLAPILDWHSGFPYSVVDANLNFVGPRDSQRFPAFFSLDLTLLHDTRLLHRYTLQWGFDVYNVTNHFNPADVQANLADPAFGAFLANRYRYFVPELDFFW